MEGARVGGLFETPIFDVCHIFRSLDHGAAASYYTLNSCQNGGIFAPRLLKTLFKLLYKDAVDYPEVKLLLDIDKS